MRLLVSRFSAPEDFLALLARDQQSRPAAGTRIAATRTVGIDLDVRHAPLSSEPNLLEPNFEVPSAAGTRTSWRTRRRGRIRVRV